MPTLQFKNNATTTLSGLINDSQTSITVANASNFPVLAGSDFFYATMYEVSGGVEINIEIVKVTATSGAIWTVVRAQDGTTARSRDGVATCYIEQRMTAAAAQLMLQKDNNLSELQSASTARTNLGLGTLATQDSNNVTITGGSVSGVAITSIDSTTEIQDNLDGTKKVKFEISGVATGTTRTLTVPNASGTIALTADLTAYQPVDSDLTAVAGLSASGLIARTGTGTAAVRSITQPAAGITVTNGDGVAGNPTLALANDLGAVESIGTTGIVKRTAADTWTAEALTDAEIPSALTGKTYNGLSLTANATGFAAAGGTTSKTLTISNTLTFSGTDGSTLNVGAGGTLGSAAFTASTAYEPAITTLTVAKGGTGVGTLTGLVRGNGTSAFTAAVAGTDFLDPAAIGATVQGYDADLAAIAALAGTSGLLRKTAANTWSLETTAYAPLASPALTGTPTAPTAAANTNTTQVATTAFVLGQGNATAGTIAMNGTQAAGTSNLYARADHVHPTDTSRAPLASPTFTGTPAAPTAAVDTNTTQLATTAYVVGQGYLKSATAASTYAPLASPALTGTPTAPTAAVDTNTTQVATTAYVVGQGYLKSATAASTYLTTASASSTYLALAGGALTGSLREARVAIGASDINLNSGNYFTRTISGTTTLTVSNVPSAGTTAAFILELTNAGSATLNFWAGVKWAGGTAPTLTAAGVDILGFYTHDGGTTWRAMLLAKDSK